MNVTPAPAVRIVEVDAESDGQRIDNFIAKAWMAKELRLKQR